MCHSIDHQLFDFLLQFAGPALLGVSIWQYIKLMSYDPVLEISKFEIPVIIYITAGIASTFNGIIGCVGGVNGRKGAILLVTHQKKKLCQLWLSKVNVYCFQISKWMTFTGKCVTFSFLPLGFCSFCFSLWWFLAQRCMPAWNCLDFTMRWGIK